MITICQAIIIIITTLSLISGLPIKISGPKLTRFHRVPFFLPGAEPNRTLIKILKLVRYDISYRRAKKEGTRTVIRWLALVTGTATI